MESFAIIYHATGEGFFQTIQFDPCITLSILAFSDGYGTGTVPLHLSTSVNESLITYRSVPTRDPVFCGSRPGTNCSGNVWSAHFVMWTGGSVPFRNSMDVHVSVPIQTVQEQSRSGHGKCDGAPTSAGIRIVDVASVGRVGRLANQRIIRHEVVRNKERVSVRQPVRIANL